MDNLIIVANNEEELKKTVKSFLKLFEGKLYKSLSWYLGVYLECSKTSCKLSQSAYINKMLCDYGLENINTYNTPMTATFNEELDKCEEETIEGIPQYKSMIGVLIYISLRTRPDMTTAVAIFSRYQSKLTKYLIGQLKRFIGFLKGNTELGIVITKQSDLQLVFRFDSGFSGVKTYIQSRTG